jgi:hypothetical protein
MNPALGEIPDRILELAKGALAQANTHSVFADPGNEHWGFMCVINTAHAGELFLKAVIAREHPLLLFKDLFSLDDSKADALDIDGLIRRGRTHDFDKLPQIMWAATGRRVPNLECFDRLRRARNAIQHFCAPDEEDFRRLSLEFIYTIIDPLIASEFKLFAIDYHEDHNIGYDYVVGSLLRHQLRFTIPDDFNLTEISAAEETERATPQYRRWLLKELKRIGREDLLTG